MTEVNDRSTVYRRAANANYIIEGSLLIMLEFRKITLADKEWMDSLFKMGDNNSEEFNYTFCYIWREVFKYKVARLDDFVIIGSFREGHPVSYLFPSGSGDVKQILDKLIAHAKDSGGSLVFHCVLAPQKALLECLYPNRFAFIELTDYYDYVYESQSLITLAGKKLHSKRTHINRFKENNPDWTYEPITAANLPEVILMNEQWGELHVQPDDKSLSNETMAVKNAIQDFFALGMDGGLIRAGGRVIAFSMGEPLNSDTYLIHIEKAFGDIQGAYAMINQQFAEHNGRDFKYINREDDSGIEGLRRAKQSYRPVYKVEKFGAKLIK